MPRTAYWETMNAANPGRSGERPRRVARAPHSVEARAREQGGPDEVGDVEDRDVPARPRANRLRDEGDEDRQRREGGRQEERRGEDGCQREMRALVLLPLGADEMHRRNDRDEDREGTPIVRLGFRGERVKGKAGQGQPDDGELEAAAAGFRPEKMGSWRAGRMALRLIVRERSSRPNPPNG